MIIDYATARAHYRRGELSLGRLWLIGQGVRLYAPPCLPGEADPRWYCYLFRDLPLIIYTPGLWTFPLQREHSTPIQQFYRDHTPFSEFINLSPGGTNFAPLRGYQIEVKEANSDRWVTHQGIITMCSSANVRYRWVTHQGIITMCSSANVRYRRIA